MNRLRLTLGLLALVVLVASPMWAQRNAGPPAAVTQATVPLIDPVGVSLGNVVLQCNSPADSPFPAANDYVVTLTVPKRLTIGEDDCCCIGDYYQASVNGNAFNTTPNPADYCAAGTDSWGCATGTCTPLSSGRSSACLGAGTYRVTVTDPGFAGHSAAEIATELMCPAGFTDRFNTTDPTNCTCAELQLGVIVSVPDESTFKNHGQYVSAAAHALEAAAVGSTVSAECASCIINQFARSVPQSQMTSCGTL